MHDTGVLELSACEQHRLIATGQLSPTELVTLTLERISARNGDLGAIVTLCADAALAAAAAATRSRPDGVLPPLFGLPFTVKDTVDVAGVRTTAGSRLLADHYPAESAPAVRRIADAGAIVIGKTNCPEFGIGNLETWNGLFGQTRNPWDPTRSPGGSSGGESAAVAAAMSSFGVGTDYGGSVRTPAHCTGIAALRPTPGRVPSSGVQPEATSPRHSVVQQELQTVGFLARSVEDLKRLLAVAGNTGQTSDGDDPAPCAWFTDDGHVDVAAGVVAAVEAAAAALRSFGWPVTQARPPRFSTAADLLAQLRAADGVPEIEWLSRGRRDELTPLVRAEVDRPPVGVPPELTSEIEATRVAVLDFLGKWPILLMPACADAAFPIADPDAQSGPRAYFEACSRAVTLLRLPSVVVPVATSPDGLPIGVQLVGRPHRDEQVLAVAARLEEVFGRWTPRGQTP